MLFRVITKRGNKKMNNINIMYSKGTNYEVGYQIGKTLKSNLEKNIREFINFANNIYNININKLEECSKLWFEELPNEYKNQIMGISNGSGCSVNLYAQWCYLDKSFDSGCSSFVIKNNEKLWVARNNDYIFPGKWNNISVISVQDKIPIALFGLEGSIFSGTGFNKQKLWIHYNWLFPYDTPNKSKIKISPFVLLRYFLENCSTISEVEQNLQDFTVDGGMNLFVVDGKSNQAEIFECACNTYTRRKKLKSFIIGTNHYVDSVLPGAYNFNNEGSIERYERMMLLINNKETWEMPDDLILILADDRVEKNSLESNTVYSCVACMETNEIFFSGYPCPAASKGDWKKIHIDWDFK
jgi:predicted choloylglycine hydrolase